LNLSPSKKSPSTYKIILADTN